MNAIEVVRALRRHYGTAWALIEQVSDGTGWNNSGRHLDVVAFGLWPSRGLAIHGIEVKVSRQDLLRELTAPAKAEPIATRCDAFWIAAPGGIVDALQLATLAPQWGLLEVDSAGRVQTKREAAKLEPKPLDRAFVAAVMRKVPRPDEALRAELTIVLRADYEADVERNAELRAERTTRRYERIVKRVERFVELTGIDLLAENFESPFGGASAEDVAAVVLFLLGERGNRWKSMAGQLDVVAVGSERDAATLLELAARLRTGAAALEVLRAQAAEPSA